MKRKVLASLTLAFMAMAIAGIWGCSGDDEDAIVDFENYEDPCDAIIGSWSLVESSPARDPMAISFYKDKSWKATRSLFSNTGGEVHGVFSLIDTHENSIAVVRADQKDGSSTKWLLRLSSLNQDFYNDFGIVIIGDRMYISTWGYNIYTSSFIFQR